MNPAMLPLGMFGRAPMANPLQQTMPQPAPAKPSFFGQGGTGRAIAGNIGDLLLQQAGARPIYAPAMQSQHEMALQQAQAEQQRSAGLADWMAKEKWKRENPEVGAPRYFEANNGDQYMIGPDGKPTKVFADPTPKVQMVAVDNGDGTKTLMPFANGVPLGQGGAAPMGATPTLPEGYKVRPRGGAGSGPATFQPSAVMDSLIQQESGGRPGVLGPQTQYGQAQGLTQMLPATAEAVAKKLGAPWRPDLMTGTSKAAAEYQRALGQAYLEEGYSATGNIRDALHYYHGGPNRRLWGPKTRGYAEKVISRLGSN